MTPPPLTVTASEPAPAGSTPLRRLLHPLTPEAFRTGYWGRRPLHLAGWSERCSGVFDRDRLRAALARQHEAGLLVRVSTDREGDRGGAGAHQPIAADDVAGHLAAGSSICVDPVDRADPALAAYARALKHELGHAGAVTVKCYLSPERAGFNTHFDAHVVTTLQIEGSKRWRVSPSPGVASPVDNAFLDDRGTVRYIGRPPSDVRPWERPPVDREAFEEVLLEPGDLLCLPAGTWHDAKAAGGPSLSLNVAFPPADPLALLLDEAMQDLNELPAWRAGIPVAPADGGPAHALPATVREYLEARVDELTRALHAALSPQRLAARWAAAVAEPTGATRRSRDGSWAGSRPAAATRTGAGSGGAAPPPAGGDAPARRLQCVLGVADAGDAARWYGQVLGCAVLSTIPEFGWVEVSTPVPGVSLGLTELPTTRPGGGAVLDFGVDDVEAMRTVLADHGVVVTEPVREIAGVARFLLAHDPDGNQLMFFQPHEPGDRP